MNFCLGRKRHQRKGKRACRHRLTDPEVIGEQRPFSTGDLKDRKDWRLETGVFARSRAETYNGSPSSYFFDYTNTATCYNSLFDAAQGRQFCEIMGSKYCHECIKQKRKKDIEEEVFSALGISQNMNGTSLSDTILYTKREGPQVMRSPSSMAIRPNDRKWFVRLHNFNSNSEYYINPVDGIKTNLAPSCQTATFEGRSWPVETCEREIQEERINQKMPTQNEFLLVPENGQGAEQVFEWSLNRKKRKMGTANSKRKFMTFNGLPIEPPLITVDLSNQIMNYTTPNDFIEIPSCGSKV